MTREELQQLGHTDAQLDGWYENIIGKHANLADEKDDTPIIQERRARFFRIVMMHWQGVSPASPGPKMGSFRDDNPDVHEHFRTADEP